MLFRAVLIILLVALSHKPIYCETEVSGDQSGVWAVADSPFIVVEDVRVPEGEELRIEPGVEVLFGGEYRIRAYGAFQAEGNEDDSIKFSRISDDVSWDRIQIFPLDSNSILSYCIIEFSYHGITCYERDIVVRNSEFRFNSSYIIQFSECNFELQDNVFRNNDTEGNNLIKLYDANGAFIGNKVINNISGRADLLRAMVEQFGSTINIEDNIFIENSASTCIEANGIALRLIENIICNNDARGIKITGLAQVDVFHNNTIAHNQGYGVHLIFDEENGIIGAVNMVNSIVWDNEIYIYGIPSVRISYCLYDEIDNDDGEVEFGDGNIDNESPSFVDAENNDFNLTAESPCIDAGDPDLGWDPDGSRVDIGALWCFPEGQEDVNIFINQTVISSVGSSEIGINIANEGEGQLRWYISEGVDWLTCDPSGSIIDQGGDSDCIFTLNSDRLEVGGYSAIANVRSNDFENPITPIYVFLSVGEGEAPEWIDIPDEVAVDGSELIQFDLEGADPEGDDLTIEMISNNLPMDSVSFVDNGNGSGRFEWTPSNEDVGEYSATFVLSDGVFFTLSEVIFSINYNDISDRVSGNPLVPDKIEMSQAFPNPFNATTSIKFGLPEAGNVSLSLFDVGGREVMNLLDGHYQAGYSSVKINSSELSSGIYFVKLSALDRSLTTKIVSIK